VHTRLEVLDPKLRSKLRLYALLAWRLQQADALRQFDPWTLVSRAARYLILQGPVTAQERWEENSGYSPSTLATIIASVVCAAEFARGRNHDGYGQKPDGNAYDGTGEGRCWPILTGERGHYELAAGRDPLPFIGAVEKFANEGSMLSEQLWDADDLPEGKMKRGGPTGSAMPLCWAHAEYVTLVRSHKDGVCFDRIEPVYQQQLYFNPALPKATSQRSKTAGSLKGSLCLSPSREILGLSRRTSAHSARASSSRPSSP
jgi:GH15 family glucan-1,4-alpha-glucosidase